jgi:hypothetical protein
MKPSISFAICPDGESDRSRYGIAARYHANSLGDAILAAEEIANRERIGVTVMQEYKTRADAFSARVEANGVVTVDDRHTTNGGQA